MAKIDALPSLEVINTLKGTLDYYYWKGIPCVRKWPHIPHSSRTQASLTAAHLFGLIVQGWALVGGAAKTLYQQSATDQPRTARDLYVSGVLGGQHEASMSDFLDLLIDCRDYLAALQALLGPLGSVNTDDLQVDIKTALATLPVKGEDQLFSFLSELRTQKDAAPSGFTDDYLHGDVVPGGQAWIITNAVAWNHSGASSYIEILTSVIPQTELCARAVAPAQYVCAQLRGPVYLWAGRRLSAYFAGINAADNIHLAYHGYQMTIEV